MNTQTILHQIIFQLTPTRTRCELFMVAGDVTEKLTSGLLKPFLSHLQTAEEQLAKGGYSIKLQPPDCSKAFWFTKGTAERFVRFVSSPEVIERVNTIEMELVQLEETIRMRTFTSTRVDDALVVDSSTISILGEKTFSSSEKPRLVKKMRQDSIDSNDSGVSRNSKKQLLSALDARRLVLQKEQGMAFARAAAAGYELVHLLQLIMFSDCFGAARLREACVNFVTLCRRRQITGFCVGDTEWIDQDLTWALSNPTCVTILNSMKEVIPTERKREGESDVSIRAIVPGLHDEWRPHTGSKGVELSSAEKGYQSMLPSGHANLGPSSPVCEWSNSTDLYQGWPAMYTTRHNPYATFQGYQYGFSPCSQESFTTLPGMSPSDATGLYQHPMGVLSQQLSETQENLGMSSSQERKSFPSLRKLQVGHRGMQNRGRMAGGDIKSEESFVHGYEKDSSEATDSSIERSDSLRAASAVLQEEFTSNVVVRDDSRQGPIDAADSNSGMSWNKGSRRELADLGLERNRRGSDWSDLSDCITESEVPSFRVLSSGDSSITLRQNKETAGDRSFGLHQQYDTVQGSKRTVTSDKSSALFEQSREGSLGSRLKKRLDFQNPEAQRKKQPPQRESKLLDDSFYVHSPSVNHEQRTKPMIESEVQGNQIYDRMSKQALKVNSVTAKVNSFTSKQHDPDDLLMMPKQRKRAPTRDLSDVMNIDIELLKSADLSKSKQLSMNSEPSQERVKKFLDQYNEKREAKIRGEVSSSKRVEREGKMKTMREDFENRKLEMARARRPERTTLQTEAQLRADKLRLYKAGLQKIKKEKEEEERRRLEELKVQRQERIAARNPAARSNPHSSIPQGRMSSQFPSSKLGNVPPQKNRTSLPNSLVVSSSRQRIVHSQELNSKGTPPRSSSLSKPALNLVRRTAPPVPGQMGKASIGSQPSVTTESFKVPRSTKSASVRTSSIFSVVFGGRENQMSRTSSLRKSEPLPITSKDQGSRPSLVGFRGQASKDLPKSLDEMKQVGKTFLKKGSGAGSSGRSVQMPKLASPGKARVVDKRPLFSSGTPMNRLKTSRLDTKEAKISEGGPGVVTSRAIVVKNKSSTPPASSNGFTGVNYMGKAVTDDMNLSVSDQKEARSSAAVVHFDLKPSIPRYSHHKEMVTPSNKSHQPVSSSVPEKNHTPSEAAIDVHKGPRTDSTMSRLMLFDRSCTMNGDSSSNKQSIIFNTIFPIKSSHPEESTVSSGSVSRPHFKESTLYSSTLQTPCKEQSNGFKKLGQRSTHRSASEGNEAGEAHEAESSSGDEISNHRIVFHEQPKHPSQSAIKPSKTTVCRGGNDSGTSKASRPFSFLGTFRSKAAEVKWR